MVFFDPFIVRLCRWKISDPVFFMVFHILSSSFRFGLLFCLQPAVSGSRFHPKLRFGKAMHETSRQIKDLRVKPSKIQAAHFTEKSPRAKALPFFPKRRSRFVGKTDSNMRSMLECHRHVAISVFDLRAVSKIWAGHFTEKSPRAKALRFLCLTCAPNQRFGQVIKKILRLKLRDEGISFRGTTLIGMLFRLPPSQVHPTLSIVLSS